MAMNIEKATLELMSVFKKEKYPDTPKKTFWNILSEQISEEGSWDDNLLDQVKEKISGWVGKLKKSDFGSLWEDSVVANEEYSDGNNPDSDTMIDELSEELLDLVLNKIEDSIPREEYYISEASGGKKKYDDDDDDFEKDFDDDIFDDDDFGDVSGDDYYDDDRY